MGKYASERKTEKPLLTVVSACEQLGALTPNFFFGSPFFRFTMNCSGQKFFLIYDIILTMATIKYGRFECQITYLIFFLTESKQYLNLP